MARSRTEIASSELRQFWIWMNAVLSRLFTRVIAIDLATTSADFSAWAAVIAFPPSVTFFRFLSVSRRITSAHLAWSSNSSSLTVEAARKPRTMSAGCGSVAGPELRNAPPKPRKYAIKPIPAAGPMLRMPRTSEAVSSMRSAQYEARVFNPAAVSPLRTVSANSRFNPVSALRMSCPAVS